MATYSKTQGTVVLAHQLATNPTTIISAAQDVSSKISCTLFLFHGFIEAAANTDPQKWYVQASAAASGNEDWANLLDYTIDETGTPAREALTGAEADDTLAVASTTGFAAGDTVYIEDSGTLADGEWGQVESIVTDTTIDLIDTLTAAKDAADFVNAAQIFVAQIDLSAIGRLRVIYANEGATAADSHIKATMVTADSIA